MARVVAGVLGIIYIIFGLLSAKIYNETHILYLLLTIVLCFTVSLAMGAIVLYFREDPE